MLKLFKPFISDEARANVQRVLLSDQIAEGQEVKDFEYEFAKEFGFEEVVSVNSGTSSLELAYELAGISKDSEVIVPILTCTATNIPLVRRGAKIVFADIDHDLNISIEDVKRKITPNTKAIVFVHFGGNNRGLNELLKLCADNDITLIEDAAQAIGGTFWGKGDFTCVSLQAIKTLTSGDGGILICKDPEDTKKAKRLRWFGYDREKKQKFGDTDLTEAGYKYHMNNVSAAIGRGNLEHIDELIAHRQKLAEIYKSYGLFAHAWLAGGFTDDYIGLKNLMTEAGYEIGQHHYRNDKYTLFKQFVEFDCPECGNGAVDVDCFMCGNEGGRVEFPVMDDLEGTYFFVPYHHGVTEEDAHAIGSIYANSL